MKRQAVSIRDVAIQAGVSTSTVSRALNDATSGLVKSEVRDRIIQIAQDKNYRVHSGARNFRRQRTEIIGLINRAPYRQVSDPFLSEFAGVIGEAVSDAGYDLLLAQHGDGWIDRLVQGRRVDGLVLTYRAVADQDIMALTEFGLPFVVLGRPLPGQSYVSVGADNDAGGFVAGRHLYELGHRNIAAITGPLTRTESRERFAGFRRSLTEADVSLTVHTVGDAKHQLAAVQAIVAELLQATSIPSALFVASDLMAIAAMEIIQRHGLVVPGDLSIIGFDGIPLSAYTFPPLTTVRQDIRLIGTSLATKLIAQIEGKEVESETLPVELMVRRSTARV